MSGANWASIRPARTMRLPSESWLGADDALSIMPASGIACTDPGLRRVMTIRTVMMAPAAELREQTVAPATICDPCHPRDSDGLPSVLEDVPACVLEQTELMRRASIAVRQCYGDRGTNRASDSAQAGLRGGRRRG